MADLERYYEDKHKRFYFKFDYEVDLRFSRVHSSVYVAKEKICFYALHNTAEVRLSDRLIGALSIKRRSPSTEVEPEIEVSPKLLTTSVRNPLRYFRRSIPRDGPPRLLRSDADLQLFSPPAPDESVLANRSVRPAIEAIRVAVSRGRAFHFNPACAREADELPRRPIISRDGSGLSTTLYHMKQIERGNQTQYSYLFRKSGAETLTNVVDWTKLSLPGLQGIDILSDPHSGKYLVNLNVDLDGRTLRLPLQSASDGTVKWLAFVAMILTAGGVYSIEEPENFLHPRMQQYLISLIRETIEDDKMEDYFLISTHSESVINQLQPSELILVSSENGNTRCKRLQNPETVANEINETGFGLGYYYAANALS